MISHTDLLSYSERQTQQSYRHLILNTEYIPFLKEEKTKERSKGHKNTGKKGRKGRRKKDEREGGKEGNKE